MSDLDLQIQLRRDMQTGEWYVERIDASRGNVRQQTTFRSPQLLRSVFVEEVADFIIRFLPLGIEPRVTSTSSQDFPTLGLYMEKVRFLAQPVFAGAQQLVIRIVRLAGRAAAMFLPEVGANPGNVLPSPVEAPALPS